MHTIQASRTPAASLDVPTREDGADEPSPSSTWSPSDRVPAVPAIHVPRERLLDQLDACVAQPVTLICAPTGWGKTTLAAYWIRAGRAPGPVAYARFQPNSGPMAWRHLVEAMAAAGLSTDPTTYPCRSTRRGERAVVILDDLHHVTNQAVLYRIERLVTRVGDRVAFVMLARSEPHLSLYRWRVRGQLIELRTDHLAFRQDEVAQVLARYGLRLPQPVRSALWRLTEGWPAALAVALAAMAGRREPERVITDLIWGEGGLNEEVGLTEYVRREILQHLDPDVRAVLLRTSILETVCPGLVEALTGHRNGVRILAQMSRSNALARFYGGAHAWYRYRRLLRVTLRAELYTSMPGQVAGLHRAAAGWYAANGMPSDAVEHALAGGDWVSAERLFQQYWPEVTGTSGRPMAPAADGQPPDDIARRPLLAFAHAISCRDTGDYAAMSAFIRLGERGLGEAPGPEMMEILVAMRLAEAQAVGDHERLAAIGRRLLAQTAEAAPGHRYADSTDAARAVAYIAIAAARLCTGDLNAADTATQQGLDVARQSGFGLLTVTALRQRAFVDLGRGRLSAAAATARRVIDRARDAGIVDAPCVGYARIVLAAVCLERGQLDDAEFHLQEGIATSTPYDPVATTVYALTLAEFHYDRGDYAEVVEALTTLRDQRTCPLPPALDAAVVVLEARLCIAIGQLGRARALLTDAGLVDRAPVQAARTAPASGLRRCRWAAESAASRSAAQNETM